MIDKDSILESWIMVEHLSEGDISDKSNDIFKINAPENNDYYSILKKVIKDEGLEKKSKSGIEFYFDIFDFDEVVSMLREKFGLNPTYEEINTGKKFSFVFCFDNNLNYKKDMTFFTESAYIRYFGKIPSEKDFRKFEEELKEDSDKDFNETSENPEKFNKAIIKVLNEYKISPENCRLQILKNIETSATNLHSFFIDDLKTAKDISTPNLELYLYGNKKGRVNLDSQRNSQNFNPDVFEEILQPKNYPLGRFPSNTKYSLSLMQQVAVNLSTGFDKSHIRSVNGPPGTGKTTLLKDVFAQLIVQQAYDISRLSDKFIKGSEDTVYFKSASIGVIPDYISENNIVVASSNNGAVQNIVNELPLIKGQIDEKFIDELKKADYFYEISNSKVTADWNENRHKEFAIEQNKEEKFWGLFSLEGGKSNNMNNIINNIECAVKYLEEDYIPDDSIYNDFLKSYEKVKQTRDRVQLIAENLSQYQKNRRLLDTLESNRQYDYESKKNLLNQQIYEIDNATKIIYEKIAQLEKQKNECSVKREKINQKQKMAELYFQNLKQQKPGLFTSKIQKNEYKNKFDQALKLLNQLISESRELRSCEDSTDNQLNVLKNKKNINLKKKADLQQQFEQWNAAVEEKINNLRKQTENEPCFGNIKPLDMNMDYDDLHLSNPWFDEDYRIEQSKLFIKALSVRKQFLYENRKNIKAALVIWNQQKKYIEQKELIAIAWSWINMTIPVISSTFASFSHMCKNLGVNTLGHLFIDEAGQALPQASVGAIFRSRHVCVVGDPSQIKPVLTLDSSILSILGKYFGVNEKYLSDSASTQTLVDEASVYGFYKSKDKSDDSWIGIPLWVHRRCNYPMFDISNKISYDGFMVQGNRKYGKADWYDIKGNAQNKYVKEQGDFLLERLQEMIKENPEIINKKEKDIVYVISPFKNVAFQLAQTLKKIGFTRYDSQGKPTNIGTIHTFQGKEAPIVFMVLGADTQSSGAARWAVNEPNMMNVAATRAKEKFYVIGDVKMYLGLGSKVASDTYNIIRKYKTKHPELTDNANENAKDESLSKKETNEPKRSTGIIEKVGTGKITKYAYIKGDDGKKYTITETIYAKMSNAEDIIIKGRKVSFVVEYGTHQPYATDIKKLS